MAAARADMVEIDTLIFDIDDTLYDSVYLRVAPPATRLSSAQRS